jgi:hypothetical protein
MSEDETYVLKVREELPTLVNYGKQQIDLAQEPLAMVFEAITGAITEGKTGLLLGAGRMAAALLIHNGHKQFAAEIKRLREKGKLDNDFIKKKHGYQTWMEVMKAIDEGTDEEKLDALKAMFLATNKMNATDQEHNTGYQLFLIAKKLSSGELLLLSTLHKMRKEESFKDAFQQPNSPHGVHNIEIANWLKAVSQAMGHGLTSLIEHDEVALMLNKLITPRLGHEQNPFVPRADARLTNLGVEFCKQMETFRLENQEN